MAAELMKSHGAILKQYLWKDIGLGQSAECRPYDGIHPATKRTPGRRPSASSTGWSQHLAFNLAYELLQMGDLGMKLGRGPLAGTVSGSHDDAGIDFISFNVNWKF